MINQLIDELDRLRATRDDAWQIPRAEGDLLYHIALAMRAKTIVEIGTSYGFSGLFWAKALQQTGGQLHTIDRDPKKYNSSRESFARAGVDQIVNNYLGEASQILANMTGPIDIAFIDADKPATRGYFDLLWPMVRVGRCIITDNAATHRKELADFISHVRSLNNGSSVEVNVGNGIEWTIKTG
jgi:predicted O-methyltransferase YrrM